MTDEIRKLLIEASEHAYDNTVELEGGGCPSKWVWRKMDWCEGHHKCKYANVYVYGTSPEDIRKANENYRYRLNCWIRYWSNDKVTIDWDKEGEE